MRTRGSATTGGAHRPATRFGRWRAAAAAPAMFGSLLLLSVTIGGLDPWAEPILLIWVGCAAVTLTRAGERLAVRAALGFRRPARRRPRCSSRSGRSATAGRHSRGGHGAVRPARPAAQCIRRRAAQCRRHQPGAGGPPDRPTVGWAGGGRAGARTGPSRRGRSPANSDRDVAGRAVARRSAIADRPRERSVRAPFPEASASLVLPVPSWPWRGQRTRGTGWPGEWWRPSRSARSSVRWPTPGSAGVPSSLLAGSPPTAVSRPSWPPRSAHFTADRMSPPAGHGGCWVRTDLSICGSGRF
jgi:hypothetical protein